MSERTVVSRIVHGGAYHPPLLVGTGPWWERLPEDFPRRPEHFDLRARDRAQVTASAAGDVVLRTVGACLVGSLALPLGYHPGQIKRALADRDFYGALADSGDPTRFFHAPPGGVRVEARHAGLTRFRPKDGRCLDLRFTSPFEPVNPRERRAYLRHKKNRTAHLRYWSHRDGPRPTILAIHGFSADLYLLNEWFFALPWLYSIGYDVALFTLPFHGARQTRYSAFSGHGFFAGGVARINEAFGQAVLDFRIFVDHLMRERGVPRVGVTGVSLGGFTSALLAATEPRLSFAIPNVPLVSVPDLVLEWQPIGLALRGALKALGQSVADARRMLAVTSPLTYKPLLPRERLMVIGGVGDRLAPPKHSRLLAEHWGHCGLYWFPGSHLVHFDRGEYLRHTARFLRDIGFSHDTP